MSIRIRFMTAVIKKSAVRKTYPEGETGFRHDFPHAQEDAYLFGLVSMSSGEMEETLEELAAKGLDLPSCCAVGEMFHGEFDACPDIEFYRSSGDWLSPAWEARLVRDEPWAMAEKGQHLVEFLMARGWELYLPDKAEQPKSTGGEG